MNPGARFSPEPGIFANVNPKNQSLCPLEKCPAATNGAKPAKSIQPKNRPNAKAVQFTRPVTGKSQRKAKRNREPPDYPGNSLSLSCLFTTYRPHGISTAAPGSPGAVFYCRLRGFRLIANLGLSLNRRKIRPIVESMPRSRRRAEQ